MIGSMNKGTSGIGSGQGMDGLAALFRGNSAAGPVPGSMAPTIMAPQRPTIAQQQMPQQQPAMAPRPTFMNAKDYNTALASRNPAAAVQGFMRNGVGLSSQQQLTLNNMPNVSRYGSR